MRKITILLATAALLAGCGASDTGTVAPLAAVPSTSSSSPTAEASPTPTKSASPTPTKKATPKPSPTATKKATPKPTPTPTKAVVKTDKNYGTCKAAKAAGHGPYYQGQDPEYDWYDDRDNDGVVCE